jgi:hypothetical protein
MKKSHLLITSGLVLGITTACFNSNNQSELTNFILKSYKVDPLIANEINKSLNSLLGARPIVANLNNGKNFEEKIINYEKSNGRSSLFSQEVIGVKTSESIHQGIPELISKVKKQQNTAQEQVQLEVSSWLVLPKDKSISQSDHQVPTSISSKFKNHEIRQYGSNKFITKLGKKFRLSESMRLRGQIVKIPQSEKFLLQLHLAVGPMLNMDNEVLINKEQTLELSSSTQNVRTSKIPKEILKSFGVDSKKESLRVTLVTLVTLK